MKKNDHYREHYPKNEVPEDGELVLMLADYSLRGGGAATDDTLLGSYCKREGWMISGDLEIEELTVKKWRHIPNWTNK